MTYTKCCRTTVIIIHKQIDVTSTAGELMRLSDVISTCAMLLIFCLLFSRLQPTFGQSVPLAQINDLSYPQSVQPGSRFAISVAFHYESMANTRVRVDIQELTDTFLWRDIARGDEIVLSGTGTSHAQVQLTAPSREANWHVRVQVLKWILPRGESSTDWYYNIYGGSREFDVKVTSISFLFGGDYFWVATFIVSLFTSCLAAYYVGRRRAVRTGSPKSLNARAVTMPFSAGYCLACGAQLLGKEKFCRKCGTQQQ